MNQISKEEFKAFMENETRKLRHQGLEMKRKIFVFWMIILFMICLFITYQQVIEPKLIRMLTE